MSGRYPTSAPDYTDEEAVLRAARRPLDEPEDILRRWFPSKPIDSSDIEMHEDQGAEEEYYEENDDESSDTLEPMDFV